MLGKVYKCNLNQNKGFMSSPNFILNISYPNRSHFWYVQAIPDQQI